MSAPVTRFLHALAHRPLVLDAAMGTRLLAQGLDLAHDDPCLWSLDRPEIVLDTHRQDRQAGADVLLTNTFGASRPNLARLGRSEDAEAILEAAVSLARQAAGPLGFVAGCLGPVPDHDLLEYQRQADHLADQGADLLILETQTAESALALVAALHVPLPLIVSLYRLPDPPFESLRPLADLPLAALGVNCVPGPSASLDALSRFPRSLPLLAKPSAGPLDSPESFAAAVPPWLSLGVRLMGGCCGTTHAHVAALRSALDATLSSSPPSTL